MFFSTSRSNTSHSKTQKPCDVFAIACDLKSQLHSIEERFLKGQELCDELRRKCSELQEVLRLFEMI